MCKACRPGPTPLADSEPGRRLAQRHLEMLQYLGVRLTILTEIAPTCVMLSWALNAFPAF